ncbi:unnamed protein product [Mytilus coruscus]|uniref:C3H1-type domain-containing protein n=1 Tax=Mytilus coruscus TaxID=42192 RepID=A0A6J8BIJ1_MYTCO|nr:unnamed protein product [Mytilus coruscus]
MPRGRGIRRARQQNPYGGVGRGQVRRNPVRENREQRNQPQQARQEADVPQVEPEVVPQAPILDQGPQIATCNVGVQADNNVINGEDFMQETSPISCNYNNDPLLVPLNNEIDLFVSQGLKEKIWALQYVNLALLLHQNFNVPNESKVNELAVMDGAIIVNTENRNVRVKHIDNIKAWTDAFINSAKIVIQRHPLLASDLFSHIALIRGAVTDALIERVYQYDQQFRLRIAQNPTKTWSQIDGNLWFRFIAKGAYGGQSPLSQMLQRCYYDYTFKKGCFRMNCTYRHAFLRLMGCTLQLYVYIQKTYKKINISILEKHSKATYSKSNKTIFSTAKITI